jgi:hypothetical protein
MHPKIHIEEVSINIWSQKEGYQCMERFEGWWTSVENGVFCWRSVVWDKVKESNQYIGDSGKTGSIETASEMTIRHRMA